MAVDFALSVEKVFEGRVFRVPDYQRGYAWEQRQWEDLIDDLDLLAEGKDHYTGTLVLHRIGDGGMDRHGKKYEAFDIVDGQQRLTTFVILLDAIAEALGAVSGSAELSDGIRSSYVCERRLSGEPLYKLALGTDLNHFWSEVVLAKPPAALAPEFIAHRRLLGGQEYVRRLFEAKQASLGSEFGAWVLDLFDRVTHRLKLIPYEVGGAADVGVIFEVMNDRGKPLTELEKVKNYLLYVSSKLSEDDALTTQVNLVWSNLLRRLMKFGLGRAADEDQLLRAHWLMGYVPAPRDWEGTASIKTRFGLKEYRDRAPTLLGELRSYVTSLEEAATAYSDISVPTRPDAFASATPSQRERRRVVEATERLLRLRAVAAFLPLLMAARIRWPQDVAGYIRIVEACERYAFRVYRVLESRADRGFSSLCKLANRVFIGSLDAGTLVREIDALCIAYCSDAVYRERLHAERNWYAWAGIRYFLYEYEYEIAHGKSVQVAWEILAKRDLERSVEHILPQTPKHQYWQSRFDAAEMSALTHDVGNLVLTEDNSTYGNRPFTDMGADRGKRGEPGRMLNGHLERCYANSTLFQEKALASLDEWNPQAIFARRAAILQWAERRWKIPEEALVPAEVSPEDERPSVEADMALVGARDENEPG